MAQRARTGPRAGRALVIGGSLGGLFVANLLIARGWDVQVHERATGDLATRGAGIGTHQELFAVMRELGIDIDETIGVSVSRRMCFALDGSVIYELRVPQIMSAWARIYRPLKAMLPERCYRAGNSLTGFTEHPDRVVAEFSDGTREEADLLIGADGIRSTVRTLWSPDALPRYAGYIAWRGVLEEGAMPAALHAQLIPNYAFGLPEGEMILAYPVPGRGDDVRPGHRGYNFVWYRPTDEATTLADLCTDASGTCHGQSIAPPLIRPELVRAIKATAHDVLAPQIASVIELTTQPFFQAIYDLESPRVAGGRVALLGDAAFVARPHIGAGVSKAALDALDLVDRHVTVCRRALVDPIAAADGDVPVALASYDVRRRAFGTRVVERSRWVGGYIEWHGKPAHLRPASMMPPGPENVLREIGAPLAQIAELRA
ncbi:MAG: FAD-dependent oxidoreductase [Proteobacteria bacterium]|nr:FAD-dependent oxidoreductase [Burkholderiales bacterium]